MVAMVAGGSLEILLSTIAAGPRLSKEPPSEILRLTITQRLAWLDGPGPAETMTRTAINKMRKALRRQEKEQHDIEVAKTEAIRAAIREWVCNDPWQEVCFDHAPVHALDGGASSRKQAMHDGVYPPGGKTSLMKRCRRCRIDTPPNCMNSSGICDDCRYGMMTPAQIAGLPGSIGIISMARMKGVVARGENYEGGI